MRYATPEAFRTALEDRLKHAQNEQVGLSRLRKRVVFAYGPRVPAIVVSPYSRPGGVSNTVYDHTSVLATIESKWNLPALTNRDANAATVMDFLDLENPATLLDPPPIQAPSETGPSGPAPAATG